MLKRKSIVFAVSFFVCFMFVLAGPADVAGKWNMKTEGRDGQERVSEIEIKQDGDTITVIMPGRRGGDPMEYEGTVEENKLTWEMTRETQRGTFTITYTATVDGDKMEGEMSMGDRGGRPFTAERIK